MATTFTLISDGNLHTPWNKGTLVGQKNPLKLREIWEIRTKLQMSHKIRDLVLFNLAIDSIEAMGLKELSDHLTHHLSGGERQRSAFATLLAQQPEIYLLDEPLNHPDLPYQMRLLDKIVALSQ